MNRFNLLVNVIGFSCLILSPLWLYEFFRQDSGAFVGFVVFPIIVLFNLTLVFFVARRQIDLRRLLAFAFLYKMVMASLYLTMIFRLYHGQGDALGYFEDGAQIARDFTIRGDWRVFAASDSTALITSLAGGIFVLTGGTLAGAAMIFASLAFWGQFLFYRAFCIAFPDGDREGAAIFIFFLPSISFWAATIGKDAPILFLIGLATYGFSKSYQNPPHAFLLMSLSVLALYFIRPHISAMLAFSMAIAYVLGSNRRGLPGMLAKLIGIPLLLGGSYYIIFQARAQLGLEADPNSTAHYLNVWARNTDVGGSAMHAGSIMIRLALAPFLTFRPFPWEVNSVQTGIACMEGLVLFGLIVGSRKNLLRSLIHWRRDPFVFFAVLFILEASFALSAAYTNFGLLARQRVMYFPLLCMLLCSHPYAIAPRIRSLPVSVTAGGQKGRAGFPVEDSLH